MTGLMREMTGLERLRNVANAMRGYAVRDGGPLDLELMGIADLIERETAHDPSKNASMSAYDLLPECDRKAISLALDCGGVEEIKKRLMPAGMEWPRFDDWEPVRPGDEFADGLGGTRVCTSVEFLACEEGVRDVLIHWDGDDPDNAMLVCMDSGDRVKRTAPKVLDSEGVECNVGDAVWWVHNKTGDFSIIRIDKYGKCAIHDDDADEPCGMTVPSTELTHRRPMFDADGAEIRLGDTVYLLPGEWCGRSPCYGFHGGDQLEVFSLHADHVEGGIGCRRAQEQGLICFPQPSQLTHLAPVLASDGKQILKGDVLYDRAGNRFEVLKNPENDQHVIANFTDEDGKVHRTFTKAQEFTHDKPVLDADGAEIRVGEVLYSIETGDSVTVGSIEPGNPWFAATSGMLHHCGGFTHRAPVLAADGEPLEVGQTVYVVSNGHGPFHIDSVESDGAVTGWSSSIGSLLCTDPTNLTHQRPVLDADGVPIKKGDTVYFTDGREQECNTVVNAKYDYKDEPYVQLGRLNEAGYPTYTNCSCIDPSQLTHTKPEHHDSWDHLMDDATQHPWYYCKRYDIETDAVSPDADLAEVVTPFAQDLVRRAKKLAEVE